MQNPRSPKRICTRIGLALVAMLGAWVVVTYALMYTLPSLWPAFARQEAAAMLVNDVALYGLGMPLFLLVLRTIPDGPRQQYTKMRMTPGKLAVVMLVCFGLGYLFNIATVFITALLEAAKAGLGTGGLLPSPPMGYAMGRNLLLDTFFVGIVPAVGEEFMFRYSIGKKMRGSGDKAYILMSALCFSLFHTNLSQFFYTFVVGAVFAWVYTRTDQIIYPMIMHFTLNMTSVVLMHLMGTDPSQMDMGRLLQIGLVLLLWMLGTIITGIVLFIVNWRKVRLAFLPPSEPEWPYKPPKPRYTYVTVPPQYGSYYAPAPQAGTAPAPGPAGYAPATGQAPHTPRAQSGYAPPAGQTPYASAPAQNTYAPAPGQGGYAPPAAQQPGQAYPSPYAGQLAGAQKPAGGYVPGASGYPAPAPPPQPVPQQVAPAPFPTAGPAPTQGPPAGTPGRQPGQHPPQEQHHEP